MTHFGYATWLDEILEQMVKRVVDKAPLSGDLVFSSLASDDDHIRFPPGDLFVTVAPLRFPMHGGTFTGAGRYLTGFDGRVAVKLFCRYGSDQEFRSTRLLTERNRNILRRFLSVLSALVGYVPPSMSNPSADDGGVNAIVREPIRCEGFDVNPRRLKDSPWAVISSTWQVQFSADLVGGPTLSQT